MTDFNYELYSNTMDEFILKIKDMKVIEGPQITEILRPICEFLRIAGIELFHYESMADEKNQKPYYIRMYENGSIDRERNFVLREMTTGGQVAVYIVYQISDDDDWSEVERKKISVFINALYSFNGRTKLDKLCERLTFYDKDLGIPNTTFILRFFQNFIETGKVGESAACYFNIKRLTVINQMFGRKIGNQVMKKYTQGLNDMFDSDEYVFRMGGDNFGCVFKKDKMLISFL